MMSSLKMPLPRTGCKIKCHHAVSKEVISVPMTTIGISGGGFGRQIDRIESWIDCHLRPDTAITCVSPGIIQPGVIAIFIALGDGVEYPKPIPSNGLLVSLG